MKRTKMELLKDKTNTIVNKASRLLIVGLICVTLVACKDKTPELVKDEPSLKNLDIENTEIEAYDKDKQDKVADDVENLVKEVDYDSDECIEVMEIKSFAGMECVTEANVYRQAKLRTAKQLAEAYGIEYTQEEVKDYFQTESKKNENMLKSRLDVATSMESDIILMGIDNYAVEHELDFLKSKIYDNTIEDRIATLTEEEKANIYENNVPLYLALGLSQEDAEKRAIREVMEDEYWNVINAEISDLIYLNQVQIFKELRPDVYEALPGNAQGDNYGG